MAIGTWSRNFLNCSLSSAVARSGVSSNCSTASAFSESDVICAPVLCGYYQQCGEPAIAKLELHLTFRITHLTTSSASRNGRTSSIATGRRRAARIGYNPGAWNVEATGQVGTLRKIDRAGIQGE
ncbi:hypothetical protein [Mesorhizobium sp. M0910]|uniref:hypothetical protein n=1 Tax=unclassified Mesorhizobium TaxID=325217 RepID=UPI003338DE6A